MFACNFTGCDASFTEEAALEHHLLNAHYHLSRYQCAECSPSFHVEQEALEHCCRQHPYVARGHVSGCKSRVHIIVYKSASTEVTRGVLPIQAGLPLRRVASPARSVPSPNKKRCNDYTKTIHRITHPVELRSIEFSPNKCCL